MKGSHQYSTTTSTTKSKSTSTPSSSSSQQYVTAGNFKLEQSPHSVNLNSLDMFNANDLEKEFLLQKASTPKSSSLHFDSSSALSFLNQSYNAITASKQYEIYNPNHVMSAAVSSASSSTTTTSSNTQSTTSNHSSGKTVRANHVSGNSSSSSTGNAWRK